MDIGVFGATGVIGGAVVAEAEARGHRVTAFTRSAARFPAEPGGVAWRVADILDPESVAAAIEGLDLVVNAINAGEDIPQQIANAQVLPAAARSLLAALERHDSVRPIRLLVVGGGGTLELRPGVRLVDDEEALRTTLTEVLRVPLEYRQVVLAQAEALDLYRLSNRRWTYVSPSTGRINSGARTGRYRTGADSVIRAGELTAQDLAVALLDEAELPRHVQRRFAVAAA
ncbi:NAD(P)-dependent oxidoreductase [Streptomyces hoynatensis]|uniref:NAD-dependent epimerase/dehydratase family protein n=1 Tax=Streptomyces hoynatensis TaxID=1141874 RepID=A0A3A9ZDU2_9ACTN|nr:NAD(P)H-binding protein [Streptomyces hoynatensis]RKN46702.1 NAD-dependent epimerase/dehydratase family protein [Streptomyces hoynatensis]